MLNFNPTVEVNSAAWPGVSFTVRRMSQVERAQQALSIAEHQARITELTERIRILREPHQTTPEQMPADVHTQILTLDHEVGCLINAYVKPMTVRLGLVKVEGLDYGGQEPTADLLLKSGPDDLLDEVWVAVVSNMGLTYEQIKNSQSVTTSAEQEGGTVISSTAISASVAATT